MTNNLEDFEQPDSEVNGGSPKQGVRANLTPRLAYAAVV